MKQIHSAITAVLITVTLFLTGCAEQSGDVNTSSNDLNCNSFDSFGISDVNSTSTSSDNSASFENPTSSDASDSKSDLETLIENFPQDNLALPDGSRISKYEAVRASNENNTYQLGFDFSFFRYAEGPLLTTLDDPGLINWETHEFKEIPIIESPEYIMVNAGDKLDNGLYVKSAAHSIVPVFESGVEPCGSTFTSTIDFEGTLTLSGVLLCYSGGNIHLGSPGDLFFFVDPSQSDPLPLTVDATMIGADEKMTGFYVEEDNFAVVSDASMVRLGNIGKASENLSGIIDLGEYARVKITVEDIGAGYALTLVRGLDFSIISAERI